MSRADARRWREQAQGGAIESVELLPPDSVVYRKWVAAQKGGRLWDRWCLYILVGLAVGLVGFAVHGGIDVLAYIKARRLSHRLFAAFGLAEGLCCRRAAAVRSYLADTRADTRAATGRARQVNTIRRLLRHKWVGVAWLFNALFSVALVAASAHVVLRWAPAAAGSGVPEVMAQLNGCRLPRVFEWRTAAVKFASAVLCVGSGLPVGPEGPMIFLGATLGGLLSQGTGFLRRWPLLRRIWPFERFRNSLDKRNFSASLVMDISF